jgi:hypothetical protein
MSSVPLCAADCRFVDFYYSAEQIREDSMRRSIINISLETADCGSVGKSALSCLVLGSIYNLSRSWLTHRGPKDIGDRSNIDEMFKILSAFMSAGSDPEDCQLAPSDFISIFRDSPGPGVWKKARTWSGILRRQGMDTLQVLSDQESQLHFALIACFPIVLHRTLACDLNPNGVLRTKNYFIIPIFLVLWTARSSRKESLDKKRLHIDTISLLIKAGADIYSIELTSEVLFRILGKWTTPTTAAIAWDSKDEWAAALLNCGYNPEKVFAEDARRRREFIRTHRAKCSGVEISSDTVEETDGFRLRSKRLFEVED